MKNILIIFSAIILLTLTGCEGIRTGEGGEVRCLSGLDHKDFETEIKGHKTSLYTLTNPSGMEVCLTNYGARLVSIMVPDKNNVLKDVVLGFDRIDDYVNIPSDFGATIGRCANRIRNGKLVIDADTFYLPTNNIENPNYAIDSSNEPIYLHTLHGGPTGWQYQVYEVKQLCDSCITLEINSPDGDNGFPGNLVATVTYTLTGDNTLDIVYHAHCDKCTVVNMTNHAYFNLNGDPSQPITNHLMSLCASHYTPIDETFIPTGEIENVQGTPFDFSIPKPLGKDLASIHPQIKAAKGYDHNWVIDRYEDDNQSLDGNHEQMVKVARLKSPITGIEMEVLTTEPGIQVYTANFLDGTVQGKNGFAYAKNSAVCLETQHFPDTPNHPQWPTIVLRPGQEYVSHTAYHFTHE